MVVAGLILRSAVEADIEAISLIKAAAYWSNFNDLEPGSHDHPGYEALALAAAKSEAIEVWPNTIVAEIDNQPVGVCILEFNPALLSGLWVLPEMHGKGIGSRLIQEAIIRFKAAGKKLITIEVHPRNPAVRLYERHGFKLSEVTTRRSNGLGRDLPLWVMTTQI